LGLLGFILAISLCMTAGFYVGSPLTRGLPPLLVYLADIFIGILIFALSATLLHWLARRRPPAESHLRQHGLIIDAMERISRGDFNVFVESPDPAHGEFIDAINDMAKNLGTLETMRQDFISNVSHEIQSPLTSISGFAALLKKDGLPDCERRRYAEIIETESRRLSSLSDNLLKLSTLDGNPLSKSDFRLDRQLSDVILTLEPQWLEKKLIVEADLPKCVINGDKGLFSQVWVNLLANAIKFTPENGIVYVSLRDGSVKIADTGVGIPKGALPHVFERFYKADKARDRSLGGSGLGLSLVKKIVELHGGKVSAESVEGKGTTFEVSLPGMRLAKAEEKENK
jgi:signal transduction histidine kinase